MNVYLETVRDARGWGKVLKGIYEASLEILEGLIWELKPKIYCERDTDISWKNAMIAKGLQNIYIFHPIDTKFRHTLKSSFHINVSILIILIAIQLVLINFFHVISRLDSKGEQSSC